jgi:predicted nucleic acid-binding protein
MYDDDQDLVAKTLARIARNDPILIEALDVLSAPGQIRTDIALLLTMPRYNNVSRLSVLNELCEWLVTKGRVLKEMRKEVIQRVNGALIASKERDYHMRNRDLYHEGFYDAMIAMLYSPKLSERCDLYSRAWEKLCGFVEAVEKGIRANREVYVKFAGSVNEAFSELPVRIVDYTRVQRWKMENGTDSDVNPAVYGKDLGPAHGGKRLQQAPTNPDIDFAATKGSQPDTGIIRYCPLCGSKADANGDCSNPSCRSHIQFVGGT